MASWKIVIFHLDVDTLKTRRYAQNNGYKFSINICLKQTLHNSLLVMGGNLSLYLSWCIQSDLMSPIRCEILIG